MRKSVLIFGVGVNDSNYAVSAVIGGEDTRCKLYVTWYEMIRRCYSGTYRRKHPTYTGCHVTPEWLYFMTFRAWMMDQVWEGKQLDKDLLVKGNKVYGPTTCIFIDQQVNKFISERKVKLGGLPLGVYFRPQLGKYVVACTGRHLGYFESPLTASEAYKKEKKRLAIELASEQNDQRISEALLKRYLNN